MRLARGGYGICRMASRAQAAARRPSATKRESSGESAVYDGGALLGVIRRRRDLTFHASTAGGRSLGCFRTSVLAMRAICSAQEVGRT